MSRLSQNCNAFVEEGQKGRPHTAFPERHEFILAEINDFNREIELTRQDKALMKLLDQRGRQRQTFKGREVKEQLGLK